MANSNRYTIYFVGGYVRDKLLGIESKDIDMTFVINIRPEEKITADHGYTEMKQYLIDSKYKIFLEKPQMLTIRAKFPPGHEFGSTTADFVLARKETYPDPNSRHPLVEVGTLKDDLARRDLTINAMAETLDGELIDPFSGQDDLDDRILRTPIEPFQTMMDDPLRIIRVLRFSITKDCLIAPELLATIYDSTIIDRLFDQSIVSKERIREELTKMFKFDTVKTIRLLTKMDTMVPNFMDRIFDDQTWLKPTNEHIKHS